MSTPPPLLPSDFNTSKADHAVQDSPDFQRILHLPRRVWEESIAKNDLHKRITAAFKLPQGQQELRLIQAAALADAHDQRGLLAPVRVGEGKCVAYETEVFDGTKRCLVGDLVDRRFSVLSKSENNAVVYEKAVAAKSGRKKCVRLTLAEGSSVVLSTDHPVFTPNGWIHAGKLGVGSLVATPRSIPEPEKTLSITDDEVILASYLLSDGGVSQNATSFTNVTPVVVREISQVAQRLAKTRTGGSLEKGSLSLKKGSQKDFSVRGMKAFRDKWGIHGLAKEKRLPAEFWSLSKRQAALFLNRFWACDGYIENHGVGITLASEKMLDDLKFLLLRLGIRSSKKYRVSRCQTGAFDAWRLTVRGGDALKFFSEVGYIHGKVDDSKKKEQFLLSKKRNTNFDVVPISRKEMGEIFDELGFTRRGGDPSVRTGGRVAATKLVGATDGQYISRAKFEIFCEKYKYTGKYAWLAKNDLTWEKVESTSSAGVRDVYDLSVPKTKCFVGNNIVLHNTLLSFLLPVVVQNVQRPMLLLPAALVEKTWREFKELQKHWLCHPAFATRANFDQSVITYEKLGRDNGKDALYQRLPDMLIADECHRLRNRQAACTRRVDRFVMANPETVFCGMSGTITKRSIRDYWHMLRWTHRKNSPLPLLEKEMETWAEALDERKVDVLSRRDPGALMQLCTPEEREKVVPKRSAPLGRTDQMPQFFSNLSEKLVVVRAGYQRRLNETPGVISSPNKNLDCSLEIQRLAFDPGTDVQKHLEHLRAEWETPNGDVLAMPVDVWRHARELACGFYYRWWDQKRFTENLAQAWNPGNPMSRSAIEIQNAGPARANMLVEILKNGVLSNEKDNALVKAIEALRTQGKGSPGAASPETISRLIANTRQFNAANASAQLAAERLQCWTTVLRANPELLSIFDRAIFEAAPPADWLKARKRWNWVVRQILTPPQTRARKDIAREQGAQAAQLDGVLYEQYKGLHLDSPMQVALAVQQGRITDPVVTFAYQEWENIRGTYKVNAVAEWISDSTVQFCANWAKDNDRSIIWTEHRAFGERLAQVLGTGFCANGGLDAKGNTIESYEGKTVVASVAANKEGRNLQAWYRNLVVTAPPTGSLWEQMLGRTHRMGQQEDTVYCSWLAACSEQDEGFVQLMADAKYIQQTTGQSQKLLYADHV